MDSLSVLLVDDHALVRAGLRALVERVPGVTQIGEADDGHEAIKLIRQDRPCVVLMDIAMPGVNGLEATALLSKEFPEVRVIVLSMYASEEYVREAINSGAAGYVVKRCAAAELQNAITAVAGGGTYFSPLISDHITRDRHGHPTANCASIDRLTPRQREVLKLIAGGRGSREIAALLNISVKTVETHRTQLMERLNIFDVPGLVRFALHTGLTTLDE